DSSVTGVQTCALPISLDVQILYGIIAVEDLNIQGLAGGRLAKSVHDAAWSGFIRKLSYKAESAGRWLVKVNARGTSQQCPCGREIGRASCRVGVEVGV